MTPTAVAAGSVARVTWSASNANSCEARGGWRGTLPASGTAGTPPLHNAISLVSLRCVGPWGSAQASVPITVRGGDEAGLDFPGVTESADTIRFRFSEPLQIYPATYIWGVYVRSQPHYYTAFFWGNDGEFRWDTKRRSNSYYGAHPYPYPAPNYVAADQVGPRYWEISVGGLDVLSKEPVEYGRWHLQALRVWSDTSGKHHEFYWDLPDTTRLIRHTESRRYGEKAPPKPALTWGDAPWNPGKEIMNGVMRGIRVYSTRLSLDDILAESQKPLSSPAGAEHIWYLNMDPTPTDISDHSGAGHDPEWVGAARPSAWTGP